MLSKPRLHYIQNNGLYEEYVLEEKSTVIGRATLADIILHHAQVSRGHARIDSTQNGYSIVDLGSTNGTFVNDKPVGKYPIPLAINDKINVGNAITLEFVEPAVMIQPPDPGYEKGIWIDLRTKSVWVDAVMITPPLPASQFELLYLLYEANGELVSWQEVITKVWSGYDPLGISDEAVHGLIHLLQQRLHCAHSGLAYLEEAEGIGLRLKQHSSVRLP